MRAIASNSGVRRSLEDRVVLCADCDATRTLSLLISGNLVCSTCGSDNWMHLPMTANVKESAFINGELRVEEDLAVEQTITREDNGSPMVLGGRIAVDFCMRRACADSEGEVPCSRGIQKLSWPSAVLIINLGIVCRKFFDIRCFGISTGACGSSRPAMKL